MAITNKSKDTLDDFIDSLDLKSLDWAGPIDERFSTAPIFESSLVDLLKRIA